MKILSVMLGLMLCFSAQAQSHYGNNPKAGKFISLNGIKMYVETYGQGKPLLLIHGNGGSIEHMKNQISYFRKTRKVIVADSRGHGKSSFVPGQVYDYHLLTKDWAVLLDSLHLKNIDVFGWSDGGIIGLLLARDYPDKVAKVYSYGANMLSNEQAVEAKVLRGVKKFVASQNPKSPEEKNAIAITKMMIEYPNEDMTTFQKVKIPVMIATADHDIITLEHSLQIYKNLGNAAFHVMGMSNHFIAWDNPKRLNTEIELFLNSEFKQMPLVPKEYEFLLDK